MSRELTSDDPRHGSWNGYTNYGCRCRACTTAATAYIAPYVKARRAEFKRLGLNSRGKPFARRAS